MGAATKGRSTGKQMSERGTTGTSRGAARTAKADREAARETDRGAAPPTDAERGAADGSGVPQNSDGAITATATSSQQAAEQRQAVSEGRPASLGGDAGAKAVDEAKALALPAVNPAPAPATAPGYDQLAMEESRLRAHEVGRAVALTTDVGRGTAEAGKPQRRTFARLQQVPRAEPENVIEHEEVAVTRGDREYVFRQTYGGHIELVDNRPGNVNAGRGADPFNVLTTFTPEEWSAITGLSGATGTGAKAATAQSAAEQRAGVATKGGEPGPSAPLPIVPR